MARGILSEHNEANPAVEQALVEISHRLVAGSNIDLVELLRVLGEALDAEAMFLALAQTSVEVREDLLSESTLIVWHRDGPGAARDLQDRLESQPPSFNEGSAAEAIDGGEAAMVALPLLAEGDRFVGYLGIEQAEVGERIDRAQSRALSIFGDLLASYYKRLQAERALQENQERWRALMQLHPDPVVVAAGPEMLYVNHAAALLFGTSTPRELRAHPLDAFLPAHLQEAFWQGIERQHRQRMAEPFEQEIVTLQGDERIVEVLSAPTTFDGRVAAQTVLRDVTERKASEEQYRTFVQTISEGVWRIDLREPLHVEAPAEEQVKHILRHGVIGECNETMAAWIGSDDRPIGQPLASAFPQLPQYLIRAFVQCDYRLQNFELAVQRRGQPLQHFAVNVVGRVQRGRLTQIWSSFNDVSARIEMERRMVAVLEEEQERIGRDLHDGVGQLLTGIRMLSENVVHRVDPSLQPTLSKINRFSSEATERVRDICRGLAPPQLSQEPLAMALEMLCLELDGTSSVNCRFEWDEEADVEHAETKVQLFRIAQEATNNALRHAGPSRIDVRLRKREDRVVLEIEDDGSGFDVEAEQGASIGLYSMRRRASSVSARLSIESGAATGTRIRAEYSPPSDEPASGF